MALSSQASANDLDEIKKRGELRHLGVPYANFVTGTGDGLSVEVMQLFAQHLGVKYKYVQTSWSDVIGDLTGKKVKPAGDDVEILGEVPIRGDIIDNGLTILPWRQKVVAFSTPTFPTQVWLISGSDSGLRPISPSGDIDTDIAVVKKMLLQRSVLGKNNTCLDPSLYDLKAAGAETRSFEGSLNDLAPAVINHAANTALLDVPDALIALEKWPGQMLVLGPISPKQLMAVGFRHENNELRLEFNRFFEKLSKDGTYIRLVKKYYPAVFDYYPDFFSNMAQ
jgi:ABC-type amino acid transport substrate-binding protein